MRREAALMTGLSFCLGLLIGLIIHLPSVMLPDSNSDSEHHITDSYEHVSDVRSRLMLAIKPFHNELTEKEYMYLKMRELSMGEKKDTNNKVNTPSFESKHSYGDKDNIFDKHENAEKPTGSIEMGIKQIAAKVDRQGVQTPAGGDGGVDTTNNKQELHSISNRSPGFVTSDDTDNEKRERTIQYADSDSSHMQIKPNKSSWITGAYFTQQVEENVPGFSDFDLEKWRSKAKQEKVVQISEGCGRMQNRKIVFSDGTAACVRYRVNIDQMQGEIYSYYLSLVLGIRNVPPSVVLNVVPHGTQWEEVGAHIVRAQWSPDRPLIVTPWVHNLTPSYIPHELRKEPRTLLPGDGLLKSRNLTDIIELAQWSDLVVFDYLTGNVDRMVNNMFNLQWNDEMMDNPTHNLGKISSNSQLVFLDNESGLFHSYRLLSKYSNYHDTLLQGLCVFRKSTAKSIKHLHKNISSTEDLFTLLTKSEPLNIAIPRMPAKTLNTLIERIGAVYRQILYCEKKYGII